MRSIHTNDIINFSQICDTIFFYIRGNMTKNNLEFVFISFNVSLYSPLIDLFGRVFANGSIPGHVIPKTLKMILDTSLLNTLQYKVRIEGKVEQSRERSIALPYTSV